MVVMNLSHELPLESENIEQSNHRLTALVCSALLSLWYLTNVVRTSLFNVKAPVFGHRSIFEPAWLVRLRFIRGSRSIIREGYRQFKDSMFKIRRVGTDILIISNKQVDEIRALTHDEARSIEPFLNDFVGNYTCGMVYLQSDLQNRVIQRKLTPNLASLASIMESEVNLALQEIPSCQGKWAKVNIVPIFTRIVARISARVFLGPQHGWGEEWLATTTEYAENLFLTGLILRFFPRFLRPLVAPLLPSYRGLRSNMAAARRIVGGIVQDRKAAETVGKTADAVEKTQLKQPGDMLQWMMDAANAEESAPEDLAQRLLILSSSSIHTMATTMVQALYDLCAHREYFEPLRAELVEVLRAEGGWQKTALNRFRKLDSLLKESQRFSPALLLTFNRIFHKPMTLSDGTFLPAGTRIAVPTYAMTHDASHVPGAVDPAVFDAFRYSRLREDLEHPENAQRFLFAMTDSSNMAFGYGKFACPGRFYATNEMKIILSHVLLRYDLKFPNGCDRPMNFTIDTDMYPDPTARLLIRRREQIEDGGDKLMDV